MKISELMELLRKIRLQEGDIEVKTQTLSHYWDPDPKVMRRKTQGPWLLLNS